MLDEEREREIILDAASENTQTLIKMLFRKMTTHCTACQLGRQLCFQECIFHLGRTVAV
jgi:hypothetical protein